MEDDNVQNNTHKQQNMYQHKHVYVEGVKH